MRRFIAALLVTSVGTVGVARAEETNEQSTEFSTEEVETTQPSPIVPQTDEKPSYVRVGKASEEAVSAARSKQWQTVLIAAGAVAIAITALILVHNNAGH